MIPSRLDLSSVQSAFRLVREKLELVFDRPALDMNGRRISNAGAAVSAFDYVRKFEHDADIESVRQKADETVQGLLNNVSVIRKGVYANRGAAAPHANTLYLATDRDYIGFLSTGAAWVYAFGVHRDDFANRPTPTSDETNYPFYATDTFVLYYWNGSAWVEDILSTIERFGGTTSSFPALKRSSAILQARLADDSAHTDIEVADEAYDAGNWDGSVEVPTKNAVRDKIETLAAKQTVGGSGAGTYTVITSITVTAEGTISAISGS